MRSIRSARRSFLAACLFSAAAACIGLRPVHAAEQAIQIETVLLWATNDPKSPNPKHKPVDAATSKKIKELPLKWSHFFEETRRSFSLPSGTTRKETLSRDCVIEVKNAGDSKVEVCFVGKGQQVVKQSQELPKGETLVVAGNAPNETAWLVVVKRTE